MVALAFSMLLGACSTLSSNTGWWSVGGAMQQRELLVYADGLGSYDNDRLEQELHRVRRQFLADPSAYHRLKLALLLMTRGTSITNDAAARSLLSAYVRHDSDAEDPMALRPLAQYLLLTLQSRNSVNNALATERDKNADLQEKIQKVTKVVGDSQAAGHAH